jgi:hypothetical protein
MMSDKDNWPRPQGAPVSPPSITNIAIESMLESTMVLNWTDLMQSSDEGLLHMEYHTGPERFIEYVKLLSSATRGYWSVICEYWTSDPRSYVVGLSCGDGHSTTRFAGMLKFVMEHQDAFGKIARPGHDGIVQVYPPSEKENAAAKHYMSEAVRIVGEHDRAAGVEGDRKAREV